MFSNGHSSPKHSGSHELSVWSTISLEDLFKNFKSWLKIGELPSIHLQLRLCSNYPGWLSSSLCSISSWIYPPDLEFRMPEANLIFVTRSTQSVAPNLGRDSSRAFFLYSPCSVHQVVPPFFLYVSSLSPSLFPHSYSFNPVPHNFSPTSTLASIPLTYLFYPFSRLHVSIWSCHFLT